MIHLSRNTRRIMQRLFLVTRKCLPSKIYSFLRGIVIWLFSKAGILETLQEEERDKTESNQPMDWRAFANRITSSQEFAMLEIHPLAGKIERDRQYFFDGSFTTFPWGDEDMHLLMELTKGAGEPQEILPFLDIIKKLPDHPVTMELGAGWGFYSIMVGNRIPKARMILVEANPRLYEVAKKNMKCNGLADRSIIIHGAAADADGEFLSFSEDGYGSHISDDGIYKVPSVSVDGIMQQLNLSNINILHMDVQGAEYKIIEGMKKALKSRAIDYIFIGTHSNELHRLCEKILNDFHYKTMISLNMDLSVSGDGILICSRVKAG